MSRFGVTRSIFVMMVAIASLSDATKEMVASQTRAKLPLVLTSITPLGKNTFKVTNYGISHFTPDIMYPTTSRRFVFHDLHPRAEVTLIQGLYNTDKSYPSLYVVGFEWPLAPGTTNENVIHSNLWLLDWDRFYTVRLVTDFKRILDARFVIETNNTVNLEWVTEGMQKWCVFKHYKMSLKDEIERHNKHLALISDNYHDIDYTQSHCMVVSPKLEDFRDKHPNFVIDMKSDYFIFIEMLYESYPKIIVNVWQLMKKNIYEAKRTEKTFILPISCVRAKISLIKTDQPNTLTNNKVTLSLACDNFIPRFFFHVKFTQHEKTLHISTSFDTDIPLRLTKSITSYIPTVTGDLIFMTKEKNVLSAIRNCRPKIIQLAHINQDTVFDMLRYKGVHV